MQITALQVAYDALCTDSGITAVPYFLVKYAAETVQVASLADWDTFFTDLTKVLTVEFSCI